MSELAIFQQFGKGTQLRAVQGSQAVIYTRVSTPDQTENLSLETQRKACVEYAKKNNYTIVESFGGRMNQLRPTSAKSSLGCWTL